METGKTLRARIVPENKIAGKPALITDRTMHYCPGCSHGVIHKLVAEVIEELGVADTTVGIAPVGCSVVAYDYIDVDWIQAAHGRAPAIASAVKRLSPEKTVFTYQGDGDLAAIGTSEFIHTCNRGDSVVIIYVDNSIYGMTGGQMAPTTPLGMKTATSPYGRDAALHGFPYEIVKMVLPLPGVSFVARESVHKPANVKKARQSLKKAFETALQGKGTSIVEFVASCNSGWKKSPVEANKWMEEHIIPDHPLGVLKENGELKK